VETDLTELGRRFLIRIVPQAAAELSRLKRRAQRIPNPEFRHEAVSSITHKDFHVHGGCILATFLPAAQASDYVRLVSVFETAVDYLDNLCDRTGSFDEADFRTLHEALADAVTPGAPLRDYFRKRATDDGGYLAELVTRSQQRFAAISSYSSISPLVREVTQRYCELQALKHLPPGERERRCQQTFGHVTKDLQWWEGAAACGSTMPTFALVFAAMRGYNANQTRALYEAYFPHVSAFHILLDYFIDQAEDSAHGELNFVGCYPSRPAARDGIASVGRTALEKARALEDPSSHVFAVRAMCAFYCSRAKVREQSLEPDAAAIAASVDVDLRRASWRQGAGVLEPLLMLYRRMIRV
jgi:tetraprenyl-beta-curcumene synthase